ncbi:MAG TPA: AarF/UbiB family protein [Anaerolineaceae bacterium]|nr:AarF/UbiB family protein [Anaerolineaceae bacterium]HPN49991.1 AarF/UbiB family protein [Anaerolineaceae bacterium]
MFRNRSRRILWFFGLAILGILWWDLVLPRFGLGKWAKATRSSRYRKIAAGFRKLAIELGGVLIKVGQFLSSRVDVLPAEITDELAGLQDEVAPEPLENIQKVIKTEFNLPLEEIFIKFDPQPLAAASIGQVHRAQIRPSGLHASQNEAPVDVVVKVQRLYIREIMEVDMKALRTVARWIHLYRPIRRRANVPALLEEFSLTLHEEVDYLNEGKNAEIFAKNFSKDPQVYVPKIYWPFTTGRVLTLEFVDAIKITDYDALDAAHIDRAEAADRLFNTYLKQIFEDRFFHADPHPGNIFILPGEMNPQTGHREWKLTFIDFGMTGQVTPKLLAGLREYLVGVALKDGARIVKAYQILDVLLPEADVDLLERASRKVFDRFWGKTTPEMMEMHTDEARAFLDEFGGLIRDMPFQMPENMILLGRCIGILNGICTGLNKDFNFWNLIGPYGNQLVEDEGGGLQMVLKEIGAVLSTLVGLPKKADSLFDRIEKGELEVRSPELQKRVQRLEHAQQRLVGAILFAVFFMGGIQLHLANRLSPETILFLAGGWLVSWFILTR